MGPQRTVWHLYSAPSALERLQPLLRAEGQATSCGEKRLNMMPNALRVKSEGRQELEESRERIHCGASGKGQPGRLSVRVLELGPGELTLGGEFRPIAKPHLSSQSSSTLVPVVLLI